MMVAFGHLLPVHARIMNYVNCRQSSLGRFEFCSVMHDWRIIWILHWHWLSITLAMNELLWTVHLLATKGLSITSGCYRICRAMVGGERERETINVPITASKARNDGFGWLIQGGLIFHNSPICCWHLRLTVMDGTKTGQMTQSR